MPLVVNGVQVDITAKNNASSVIKQVALDIGGLETSSKSAGDGIGTLNTNSRDFLASSRDIGVSLASWGMIFEKVADGAVQVYEFAKSGAELELVETRFERLSTSIGTTSETLQNDLKEATRGLYSDAELMKSATDLMALGLAKNHDEAVRLAAVSAGLNMNMNQLVLTLTNMTTMRFDALGVSVDGFEEKVKQLKETGLSTDAAFKEAFLQQAEEQLEKVGHAADTSAGSFMRFETQLQNTKDSAREMSNDVIEPMIDYLADSAEAYNKNLEILKEFDGQLGRLETSLSRNYAAHRVLTPEMEALVAQYERGVAWTEYYKNLMNEGTISTTENAEATKEAAETISEYYETILDSAEKWHSVNKNYIETQDELKEKQQQVRDEINKLTTEALPGYQQKVEDLEIKYQDLGTQIDETAEKHRQRLGEMQYDLLMTSLSTDGLTDAEYEMGVAAGIAFGVFDQEAADAMIAQKAINDAVEDGTLDFDIYKTAIKNAMKDGVVSADELKRILDNIPKNVDINLNVRTNYSVAGQVALTQQIAGEKDYIPTFGGGKASGGPVSAGKMYEVNEQGIPELLDFGGRQFLMMPGGGNGYVTPLSGGAGGSAGGMGGGQTLIQLVINSPVTIMDEEKAVNTLIPLLEQAWNELNSRGNV